MSSVHSFGITVELKAKCVANVAKLWTVFTEDTTTLMLFLVLLLFECCFSPQFSDGNADQMKKVYGKFCSRHNEAVNLYKDLHAKDKRFQAFIKVSTHLIPAPIYLFNMLGHSSHTSSVYLNWDDLLVYLCLCRKQWAAALYAGLVFQSAFCWSLRGSPSILFLSRGYSSTLKVRMKTCLVTCLAMLTMLHKQNDWIFHCET